MGPGGASSKRQRASSRIQAPRTSGSRLNSSSAYASSRRPHHMLQVLVCSVLLLRFISTSLYRPAERSISIVPTRGGNETKRNADEDEDAMHADATRDAHAHAHADNSASRSAPHCSQTASPRNVLLHCSLHAQAYNAPSRASTTFYFACRIGSAEADAHCASVLSSVSPFRCARHTLTQTRLQDYRQSSVNSHFCFTTTTLPGQST